ncbi:uncharacterized protein ATNIH1004_005315 [Aspergillus tanneri]|uniref:Uncharacterized protein n=1 Tax=Aspergillus tanneri TaxID=1220188 RepID=A0A5M9MMV5_9EURO|nr:uncharacterized protein ATNIH1004_005315 [Aspergillus tanneri]KAA8646640.1 hypothetical protein ATNIH1004_005315 [Aspergillus tanneri]
MATRRTSVAFPDGSQPPPLLTYLKEYNCIVCIGCKIAITGQLKERHLSDVHQLRTIADRARHLRQIPRDVTPDPAMMNSRLFQTAPPGFQSSSFTICGNAVTAGILPGQSWFQSSRYLRFWTTAPVDHGRPASMPVETTEDPPSSSAADTILIGEPEIAPSQLDPVTEDNRRIKPNELPVRPLRPLAPKPVDAEPIERPTTPLQTPPLTGNHTARWIREIQHLEARGIHRQHPAQEARPDPRLFVFQARHMEDDVTPWLLQTDWLRFLDGRYLRVLAEASAPDPGRLQSHPGLQSFWPGALWDDKELVPDEPAGSIQQMSVNILDLVIASFDRVLNRALDSLASTHPPIRRLFRSSSQTGLSAVELDRQQPKTLQRYRRVWRRYLAWMVRGAPLTDQERTEILGLRLDKYEREHLTRIWDTLQAYLAHPEETLAAGHFLQRMEQTDARRQAVKRAYDRSNLGELAAISSPVPTPQTTSSTTTANSRAGTAAVRKRPRRESVTPTPLPPPMRRGHRRTASQARLLTPTKASGTRLRDPRVGGSVSTGENSPVPSPRRVERMVAIPPQNLGSPGHIPGEISDTDLTSSDWSDEEEEDFLTSTESPIPSMGDGADLDRTSRRGVPQLPPECQRWLDEMTGNKFDSSLVALTAVLAIHPVHLTVAGPYSYTSDLAAILWISRLLLLDIGTESDEPQRCTTPLESGILFLPTGGDFTADRPWDIPDVSRGASSLDHLVSGPRDSVLPAKPHWLYHDQLPSLDPAPDPHDHRLLFNRELLLGYVEDFTLADLVDVPSERRSGFSFLDVAPHHARPTCIPLLLLCQYPPSGVRPLRQVSTHWDIQAMRLYEKKVQDFLYKLALLIQVTWGQTSREKELLTIKWQNTATSQRNIFLSNGQVMIVTEYHKTRRRTVRTHPVARFLPSAVGRLLVTYLIHVRPMLVAFNSQHPRSPGPVGRPSMIATFCYSFLAGFPAAPQVDTSSTPVDSAVFNSAYLTTLSYRHLSIAIAKKHLRPQMTGSDLQSAETVLHNILAAQAGHHSHINNQIYAVEDTYPLGLLPSRQEAFQRASAQWHRFILFSGDHSPCPGNHDPSSSGRG